MKGKRGLWMWLVITGIIVGSLVTSFLGLRVSDPFSLVPKTPIRAGTPARPLTPAAASLSLAAGLVPPTTAAAVPPAPSPAAASETADQNTASTLARLTFGTAWKTPTPGLPALGAFARWTDRYLATGSTAERAALIAEGVQLAQNRRAVFAELIRAQPAHALAATVPAAVRAQLPGPVTDLLEERVSGAGDLRLVAVTPVAGGAPSAEPTFRTASVNGRYFHAHVYGRRERQTTKVNVSVAGVALDGELAVAESPVRVLEPGEPVRRAQNAPLVCPVSKIPTADQAVAAQPCGPAIEVGGRREVLCCEAHVAVAETRYVAAENASGPYAGALSTRAFEAAGSSSSTDATDQGGAFYPASWTEGAKRVLFIRVDFSDLPGVPLDDYAKTPLTPDYIQDYFFGSGDLNGFLGRCSYGQTSLVLNGTDVTSVLRLPKTAAYYAAGGDGSGNSFELHDDAEAAATAVGYDLDQYDRLVVEFGSLSSLSGSQINYGGLGDVGGKNVWINGFLRVLPHELGHTYGLQHANLYQTTDGTVTGTGTSVEYGDPSDVMGGGTYHGQEYNMWSRNLLGWMPDAAVANANTSGVYRIYRYDSQNASLAKPLAIKIPGTALGDAVHDYWIGLRESNARDGAAGFYGSAYVLWGYHYSRQSDLLDMNTPGSDASDAPLQVGQTFSENGLTIQPIAVGGTDPEQYLDVRVTFGSLILPADATVRVDENAGRATVTLDRSGGGTDPVSVHYQTADGIATAGTAYQAVSGTVSWAQGDTAPKTIVIPLTATNLFRNPASFVLQLSGASGATIPSGLDTINVQLQPPGTMDDGLAANLEAGSATGIDAVLPQADGGALAVLATSDPTTNITSRHLSRLDAAGLVSTLSAASALDGSVDLLVPQPDGKLLIKGKFQHADDTARPGFARLNADGSLDTTFAGPTDVTGDDIHAIAVSPDGGILIGGAFGVDDDNDVPTSVLQRLNPDGSRDATLTPPTFAYAYSVEALALQPDGKLLVGGSFGLTYNQALGHYPSGLVRLNADGGVDPSFVPVWLDNANGFSGSVSSLTLQGDGSILAGGYFDSVDSASHAHLARLQSDGTLDATFNPAFALGDSGYTNVDHLLAQPDGSVLAGGDFAQVNGSAVEGLARIKADGTLDAGFTVPGVTVSALASLAAQPDGSILAGGYFDTSDYGSQSVLRLFSGLTVQPGVVQFASSATVNAFPGGTVTLAVSRTGGSDQAISINYATEAGTAVAGMDFTPQAGTLGWAAGDASSKTITVQIPNSAGTDLRTLSVNLGIPLGGVYLGDPAATTVQIGNAGAAPTLVVPAQPVNAAVSTPFSYQVVSTGSGVTFGASGLPDGLSIDPGTGIISGAPTVAGSSSVTLTATNAYGQTTATLSLQVKSSSDLPVVTLTADTPSASVGGGQPGVFTLSLSAAQATDTVVSFTVKGTAVNGSDYVLLKTTKKIKAGKTSKPIKITPQGDLGGAAKKTVVLTLQPGGGYTVGTTGKVKVKILSGQ